MLHAIAQSILLDAAPVKPRWWDINPVISPWLLFLGAIAAAVSVFYLYRAQQKIASPRIVAALTVIRCVLILLVFFLLLGPVLQWTHIHHSNGTLWVLADESLSMKQADPQATDQERLRWADSLGYLPPDLHPARLDVPVARLTALRDDMEHYKTIAGQQLVNDDAGQKKLETLAKDLKGWYGRLTAIADDLDKNPILQSSNKQTAADLHKLAATVSQSTATLESAKPEDAAETLPTQAAHDGLSSAIAALQPIADKADADFLREHGSDSHVKDALSKVRQANRSDLAFAALTGKSSHGLKSLAEAMNREDVKIVRFGDRTELINPEKKELEKSLRNALTPAGQNTDIASALHFVGEQLGEDSTVLVVSDGRQNVGSNPEAPAQLLGSRGARVFTLTVGSHETARDAAVEHVDAPDWVFSDDQVVISPVIRLDGLKPTETVTVELRRGDELIDHKDIKADQEKKRLTFTDKPAKEGNFDYTVSIKPVPDEAVLDNNSQVVRVAVKKDKLKILIVEDEARHEYQFLRSYLSRDHRVQLQTVLLEPGRIEGIQAPKAVKASPERKDTIDAQELPSTRDEWSKFDIVVLGDIPPASITPEQQKNIAGAVRDGNIKGLILIAGARNMPLRYNNSPLAEILPVDLGASRWTPQELKNHTTHGFAIVNAPEGVSSVLSQFSPDPGINEQLWAGLAVTSAKEIWWHSDQTAARPGASVIWSIEDAPEKGATGVVAPKPRPAAGPNSADEFETIRQRGILMTMNVGLGRVMYLASPFTYKFRAVETVGPDKHMEDLHRRFWGQVVRWAVGSDMPAGNKYVRFGTDKHSYVGGEPVVVTARLIKEDFSPLTQQTFKILANRKGAGAGSATIEGNMVEAPTEGPGFYRGIITLPAGAFALSLQGGEAERLLGIEVPNETTQRTLDIDVAPNATVEDRNVNTDAPKMASIAKAGCGVALDGHSFDVLADHLPVVDHTDSVVNQAGLFGNPSDPRTKWSHWIFFGIFVALITAEWILRKRGGLV